MYTVYVHINKLNKKLYFGITKLNPTDRWQKGNGYNHSPHFMSAINKYGWNNFKHIILIENLYKEDALYFEKQLIALYDTRNPDKGYNLDSGGFANEHSEETKLKISESLKGRIITEEHRLKISDALSGYKWPKEVVNQRRTTYLNNNHHLSDQHKQILSECMKGNNHGATPCKNSTKEIISLKLLGNKNGNHPIICVETLQEYSSMQECCNTLNISMYILRKAIANNKAINNLHYIKKQKLINA